MMFDLFDVCSYGNISLGCKIKIGQKSALYPSMGISYWYYDIPVDFLMIMLLEFDAAAINFKVGFEF